MYSQNSDVSCVYIQIFLYVIRTHKVQPVFVVASHMDTPDTLGINMFVVVHMELDGVGPWIKDPLPTSFTTL